MNYNNNKKGNLSIDRQKGDFVKWEDAENL